MAVSRNPVLTRAGFDVPGAVVETGTMTLAGTIAKTAILLGMCVLSMVYVWFGMPGVGLTEGVIRPLFIVGFIGGVGLLLYTARNPDVARVTGPIYAVLQGLVLGLLTLYMNTAYPGIPLMAAAATVGTFSVMLIAYRVGAIRATERFKTIVISATLGVFGFYIVAFVMQLFGIQIPMLHEGGVIGIGFSLFVIALAAFNLILDFDLIEQGVGSSPAEYEWLAAFGLTVTLIWLYTEILRLMGKVNR